MTPSISTIWVNGKSINAPVNSTIMQACMLNNIEIPRFCYHEQLAIAGNCRMCLVEVEKSPKLVASCAMPIINGMKVVTTSSIVKKAREGVLEFLLLNHPLDCPICDQGGECDLQDQAMIYGSDRGRFFEFKRTVQDKNVGPLIKTIMTRCIHCTRCVRFISDVANAPVLGTTGRGTNTEITTYIKKLWLNSNISGNIIDLCPVGALTSKPYAFKARPWELQTKETFDILDPFCMKIRVDLNPFEIVRVLPLNNNWITDKTRFSYDGFNKQRLLSPLYRDVKTHLLKVASWSSIFKAVTDATLNKSILFHIGNLTNIETLLAAKLFKAFSTKAVYFKLDDVSVDYVKPMHFQGHWLKHLTTPVSVSAIRNSSFLFLSDTSVDDMIPLLSTFFNKNQHVVYLGVFNKALMSKSKQVGTSGRCLLKIVQGKHFVSSIIKETVSSNMLLHKQFSSFDSITSFLLPRFTNQLPIQSSVSVNNALRVLSQDLFYTRSVHNSVVIDTHWMLNSSNSSSNMFNTLKTKQKTIIYQGTHAETSLQLADIVLPGLTYTEVAASYVDVMGNVKQTHSIQSNPSQSFICSEAEFMVYCLLLSKLSTETLKTLNYMDLKFLIVSFLRNYTNAVLSNSLTLENLSFSNNLVKTGYSTTFTDDYFTNNNISRASSVMARCSMLRATESFNTF